MTIKTIEDLPIELMCVVMSYLNKNDRKNVSLITKKWRLSYKHASILKNIKIKANDYYISSILANENSSALYIKQVVNLEFINSTQLSAYFMHLINNNLNLINLKTLDIINNNNLNINLLVKMLQVTPNLERLNLIECDSLFLASNLPDNKLELNFNLTELSLSKNRHLTNRLFNYLIKNLFNKITSLDISHTCLINMDNGSNETSQTLFTLNNVLNTLKEIGTIKRLNLSSIDLFNSNKDYVERVQSTITNLNELIVDSINLNSNKSILNKELKVLKLTSTSFYDNQPIDVKLNVYQELQLRKCSINSISKQPNLVLLDLSNSKVNQIEFDYSYLTTLNLSYCDFITDTHIIQIAKVSTKLKHLDLKSCTKITDTSVNFIVNYLILIEYLDLSWCRLISDYGFNTNAQKLKYEINSNSHTNFGNCKCSLCINRFTRIKKEKTDPQFSEMETFTNLSLESLKNLKYLKLESCLNLTDNFITPKVLGQLFELNINLCTNITLNLPIDFYLNLNILNISQCHQINEDKLINLLKYSRNLKSLHANACPAMTNSLISFMITNKIILHFLDCSFCCNLNETCVNSYESFLHDRYNLYDFICEKRFLNK
jgi:hypothetical protein